MDDQTIIAEWEFFYNLMCNHIRTKDQLLFLVAHFCLMRIVDMEYFGNCTSESDDETESLPKAWNAGVERCVWKYKSGNHVYTLLGEVTNAYYLLNFKNRQIKALSNDLTLNVDDMTDVINGRIKLRKPVQEVTKLLLDDLYKPVLYISRAVFDLHTNSNGQLDIPPSLENADLLYLRQHLLRHCIDSERNLDGNSEMSFNPEQFEGATETSGTLTAAIESAEDSGRGSASSFSDSSGVISPTPGGYSGMYLNPHSSSNSHYFGGIEDATRRFLTPGGYNGMLVNPTDLASSQYFGGFNGSLGNWTTPEAYNGMLVNPTDLANFQYFGGFERIPGSSPTPTLGWGEMMSYRQFLTNPKPLGGATETVGRFTNEIDLPEAKRQRRSSKYSDQFRPPEGLVSSFSGSLGRTADMSLPPGSYDRLLSLPLNLTNPTRIRDQGGSDSGQFPSASALSSSVCARGSEEFSSLGRDGKMLSYPNDLTNPKPLGGAAETVGRFTYKIDLP